MNTKEKEKAILFFLLKYGILITFEDQSYLNYNPRINSTEAVTFKDWKETVFNDPNVSICIHIPQKVNGNKKMANLQNECSSNLIRRVMRDYKHQIQEKDKLNHDREIRQLRDSFNNFVKYFPKTTLDAAFIGISNQLEESVSENINKWVKNLPANPTMENIIIELIKKYNNAVKEYRNLKLETEPK